MGWFICTMAPVLAGIACSRGSTCAASVGGGIAGRPDQRY